MTLLVAGGDRVDAGKTTFTVGLLAHLRDAGAAPVGFKPRAGNDYWFDHDDYRAAVAEGRLYGKDARKLAAAGAGEVAAETINPVHRLWRPTPGETGLLGEPDRTFLLDRVTTPDGPLFVRNGEVQIPDDAREVLPLDGAVTVDSVAAFNEVMADRYLPAFERVRERTEAVADAVVESYADIALPLADLDASAVAVVDPGRVRIYGGEPYLRAREAVAGGPREGRLEERVGDVIGGLDAEAAVELPPLPDEVRSDPGEVAEAYRLAYEVLLDVR